MRKRIERICAGQEGIPDEDCPDLISERYYWCTTATKLSESDKISTTAKFSANVNPTAQSLGAFSAIAPNIAAPKAPMPAGVKEDLLAHIRSEGSPSGKSSV